MRWEYWLIFAILVALYSQHRRINIRKKALELASMTRAGYIADTEVNVLRRAVVFAHFIRSGRSSAKFKVANGEVEVKDTS